MGKKVLIVGGGPAGSACGIESLEKGLEAVVFERGGFEREKVCGDGLSFDSQRALNYLGVYDEVREMAETIPRAIVHMSNGRELEIEGPFYTLQRSQLDHLLREKVKSKGGEINYETKIEEIMINEEGVQLIDNQERVYEGDVLVLATGANTKLAKSLGFDFPSVNMAAIRGYLPNDFGIKDYLFWINKDIKSGYGWAFPCPDDLLNVGVSSYGDGKSSKKLNASLSKFTKEVGLDESKFIDKPRIWPIRVGLRRGNCVSDRVILVGENIDCTYSISGEGIGKALESGILAAQSMVESNGNYGKEQLLAYEEKVNETMTRFHDGYNKAHNLVKMPFGNILASFLTYTPKTEKILGEIARETLTADELVSPIKLMKTLFRI
jgi:flavin-dependent dehydrogenase